MPSTARVFSFPCIALRLLSQTLVHGAFSRKRPQRGIIVLGDEEDDRVLGTDIQKCFAQIRIAVHSRYTEVHYTLALTVGCLAQVYRSGVHPSADGRVLGADIQKCSTP